MKIESQLKTNKQQSETLSFAVDQWFELALLTLEHKKLTEIKKRKNGKRI